MSWFNKRENRLSTSFKKGMEDIQARFDEYKKRNHNRNSTISIPSQDIPHSQSSFESSVTMSLEIPNSAIYSRPTSKIDPISTQETTLEKDGGNNSKFAIGDPFSEFEPEVYDIWKEMCNNFNTTVLTIDEIHMIMQQVLDKQNHEVNQYKIIICEFLPIIRKLVLLNEHVYNSERKRLIPGLLPQETIKSLEYLLNGKSFKPENVLVTSEQEQQDEDTPPLLIIKNRWPKDKPRNNNYEFITPCDYSDADWDDIIQFVNVQL